MLYVIEVKIGEVFGHVQWSDSVEMLVEGC